MSRAEWTNALPNVGSGLGLQRDLSVITDYFPLECNNPDSAIAWAKIDRHAPRTRYTWYDRYLWKRYEEMRELAHKEYMTIPATERANPLTAPQSATRADITKIDNYTSAFFDRYLRHRRYYRGSMTQRE